MGYGEVIEGRGRRFLENRGDRCVQGGLGKSLAFVSNCNNKYKILCDAQVAQLN